MKPAARGSSTVSPCLMVESINDELRFLKAVFGAQVGRQQGGDERTLWQVEVRLGDATLMIGRTNKLNPQSAGMLYVWTGDVDATYARAMKAGATLISAPTDQPSGVREAGFKDPQGQIWWLGERVRKVPGRSTTQKPRLQRRKSA